MRYLSNGKAPYNPTLSLVLCQTNADLAPCKIVGRIDPGISKAKRYLLELFQDMNDEIGGTPCQVSIVCDKTIQTIGQILACPPESLQIANVTKQLEKPISTSNTVLIQAFCQCPGFPYEAGLSSIFPTAVDTVRLQDKNALPFLYQSQKGFSVPMNLNHEEEQKDTATIHGQCRFLPI